MSHSRELHPLAELRRYTTATVLLVVAGCSPRGASEPVTPLSESDRSILQPPYVALRPVLPEPELYQWNTPETAADSLGRIGIDAVPGLIQALRHAEPRVRAHAAQGLAVVGPGAAPAVGLLAQLVERDPDETVRHHAARALGQIGPQAREGVPALIHALERPTPSSTPAPIGAGS